MYSKKDVLAALADIKQYFDNRADADLVGGEDPHYVGNTEMHLLAEVEQVIAAVVKRMD